MANLSVALALDAVCVAWAIRKPTVTMMPHFLAMNVLMLGLADRASCMPCQDEALNDRSSMPPVSVTMQPRNLPAVDADELFPLGLADAELETLVFELLLPHAAASGSAFAT